MTNVNASAVKVSPIGGAALDGLRTVYITGAKAAQNDTITVTGVSEVVVAQGWVTDGTDKSVETITSTDAAPTVLTLAGATTGTVHIMALVR